MQKHAYIWLVTPNLHTILALKIRHTSYTKLSFESIKAEMEKTVTVKNSEIFR